LSDPTPAEVEAIGASLALIGLGCLIATFAYLAQLFVPAPGRWDFIVPTLALAVGALLILFGVVSLRLHRLRPLARRIASIGFLTLIALYVVNQFLLMAE
jgi:hypothetical protein